MNRYGALAREHWEKYAPSRVAALEDPEEFFAQMGEQIQGQVDSLSSQLETKAPAAGEYQARVAQLDGFRAQAEESVLAEVVYSVEAEHTTVNEELTDILFDLPSAGTIQVKMQDLIEKREANGFLDDWDQAELDQATRLLPLISFPEGKNGALDRMSEAEMRDLILALQAFWDPDTHQLRQH
jgi:hypothetical protein